MYPKIFGREIAGDTLRDYVSVSIDEDNLKVRNCTFPNGKPAQRRSEIQFVRGEYSIRLRQDFIWRDGVDVHPAPSFGKGDVFSLSRKSKRSGGRHIELSV